MPAAAVNPQQCRVRRGPSLVVLAAFCLVAVAACGPSGPPRYRVSGRVTLGGEPVPGATLIFAPNKELGNQGPGTLVIARDGRYETPKGTVGGPHVVTVTGYSEPVPDSGQPVPFSQLFPAYEFRVDLPMANAEQDFDVPASQRSPPRVRPPTAPGFENER